MRGEDSKDEPGGPDPDGDPPPAGADPTPALLAVLLRLLGRAADPARIAHEHGCAMSEAEILCCARAHDAKARAVDSTVCRLDRLPLPALAGARDGSWFILGAARDGKALVQEPNSPRPVELTEARLAERRSGRLILLATRETTAGARRSFDVSWFIPPVVRFRRILLSVLIGKLLRAVGFPVCRSPAASDLRERHRTGALGDPVRRQIGVAPQESAIRRHDPEEHIPANPLRLAEIGDGAPIPGPLTSSSFSWTTTPGSRSAAPTFGALNCGAAYVLRLEKVQYLDVREVMS